MSFPNIFQAKKWHDLDGAKQLWRHNNSTTTHQRHIFSTHLKNKRKNATYTTRIRASEALRKASALARRNRRKAQTARRRVRTTAALLALHFERPTPGPTNHANQVCATWILCNLSACVVFFPGEPSTLDGPPMVMAPPGSILLWPPGTKIETSKNYETLVGYISLNRCFSVLFIGFPITSRAKTKNWRGFPLGGPSPCGKAGLAPCRLCTFSSFLAGFMDPQLERKKVDQLNLELQNPKSNLQNHK